MQQFLSFLSAKKIFFIFYLFLIPLFGIVNFVWAEENQTNQSVAEEEKNKTAINLNNVSLRSLASAISEITNKNFIIDPTVSGKVSFISGKQILESELYQIFLIILQAYNFDAVEINKDVIRIMPRQIANENNMRFKEDGQINDSFELVTTIIELEHINVNKAIEIVRPLIPRQSYLASYGPANDLIIAASEATITQIKKILKKIDIKPEVEIIEFIELKNAKVTEVINILNQLESFAASAEKPVENITKISADLRTNSIILKAKPQKIKQLKLTIAQLDKALENDEYMQVINLNYLEATKAAEMLNRLFGQSNTQNPEGGMPVSSRESIYIEANEQTNSLIIQTSAIQFRKIKKLIDELDVKKSQVLVEAIIADVSDDFAMELGVQWAGLKEGRPIGMISFSQSSNSIDSIVANKISGNNQNIASSLGSGAVAGITSGNWGVLLNALENNSNANVLSRPSIVTLNNQEAEIFVGENIPLISSIENNNNSANPITNVTRENVGIKLKVKPTINPDNKVMMEIEQEISSINSSLANLNAIDLITRSRKINTKVNMNDKEIIVLGGLNSNESQEIVQKVPILSQIPILGNLFQYKTQGVNKKSLMVFLRVVILPELGFNDYPNQYQKQFNLLPILTPPDEIDFEIENNTNKNPRIKLKIKNLPHPFKEKAENS